MKKGILQLEMSINRILRRLKSQFEIECSRNKSLQTLQKNNKKYVIETEVDYYYEYFIK